MAAVSVAADRAVLGDLPAVCVRTGDPADAYITVVTKVGGPSPWTLARPQPSVPPPRAILSPLSVALKRAALAIPVVPAPASMSTPPNAAR